MKSIIISVLGDDKPGLVDNLSDFIVKHGGDWVDSRMLHLGDKFAGILSVNVKDADVETFIKDISNADLGLNVLCETTDIVSITEYNNYHIDLIGQNRPGIIHELTHVLAEFKANVEDLTSEIVEAPMSGEELFKATINIHLPKSISKLTIKKKIEKIANEFVADIQLK
jgi:glycine cleavage system regulatory protein